MDLIKKNITIVEAVNDGTKVKIKDQDNLSYTFFIKKQDGTESMAYQFFKTLEANGKGVSASIGYKETQGEFKGQPVTYRNIAVMGYGNKQSVSQTVAQVKHHEVSKDAEQEKWDRLGWGKCKTLFLVEAFKSLTEAKMMDEQGRIKKFVPTTEEIETIEKTCEAWADMCMRKREDKPAPEAPKLDINDFGDMENSIEEIPF